MPETVLITGANGYIGCAILIKALESGYVVRGVVRSLAKATPVAALPQLKSRGLDRNLTFVEIPDMTAPNAYHEAVKGVDYIVHVASPIVIPEYVDTDWNKTIFSPAIDGTTNILKAATESSSVRRIVFTSSVVANANPLDAAQFTTPDTRRPTPTNYTDLLGAYFAAKHSALNATDKFIAENETCFDIVNVMPSFVYGRRDLATDLGQLFSGSNSASVALLIHGANPDGFIAAGVHLDDVVKVHMDSFKLSPGEKIRNFALNVSFDPNSVVEIVENNYPQLFENGTFQKPTSRQSFHNMNYDCSETERVFGFKMRPFEEQVRAILDQAVEIQGNK